MAETVIQNQLYRILISISDPQNASKLFKTKEMQDILKNNELGEHATIGGSSWANPASRQNQVKLGDEQINIFYVDVDPKKLPSTQTGSTEELSKAATFEEIAKARKGHGITAPGAKPGAASMLTTVDTEDIEERNVENIKDPFSDIDKAIANQMDPLKQVTILLDRLNSGGPDKVKGTERYKYKYWTATQNFDASVYLEKDKDGNEHHVVLCPNTGRPKPAKAEPSSTKVKTANYPYPKAMIDDDLL